MCCLFGILDYRGKLTLKERQRILKVLSTECEARGTDATGIAKKVYNNHPFGCHGAGTIFALAHNGVLHNEDSLRREYGLQKTRIETDSSIYHILKTLIFQWFSVISRGTSKIKPNKNPTTLMVFFPETTKPPHKGGGSELGRFCFGVFV